MSRDKPRFKIDVDTSTDDHYNAIRSKGQQYLIEACRQNLPPPTRQRILQASLSYLESRTQIANGNSSIMSQQLSQSVQLSQGAAASTVTRDSAFQSHLTSLVDVDIPPHTLIDACAKAADINLLPILAKCLATLAQMGHIKDLKSIDGKLAVSQSQYEDHELVPTQLDAQSTTKDKPRSIPPIQTVAPPEEDENGSAPKITVRRTGQNFVDEFVSKLVEFPASSTTSQSRASDVFIASVAREAPLSEHATEHILHLLTCRMRTVDIFELPAFIYQLLLFASARGKPVVKSQVLLHISEVFEFHEKKIRMSEQLSQSILADDEDAIMPSGTTFKDLREVQGTALLHIEYAAQRDPSLATEVIKLTKSGVENPRHFLSSFGAGIILLLARSASLQSNVLQLLREVIARFDKERLTRHTNLYVARVAMNDDELLDPRVSLTNIANSTCEHGWDFVKESLLAFSFVLLDKPLVALSSKASHNDSLANALIIRLFNSHAAMRPSILEQLQSRIALREKSAFHAICIIKKLSNKFPYFMLEHQEYIRDTIELLTTLPPWLASDLIQAFKPFFVLRHDLQDHFNLFVRKSLFHTDTSSRAVSVSGFLSIVSILKEASPDNSQVMESQDPTPEIFDSGVNVIIEIIQPLRRVFSFPAALRAFMYKSSIHCVDGIRSNKKARQVSTALQSVLISHVQRFIDVEKAPFILLDHCVNEAAGGMLAEPLGDLVWCLAAVESRRALNDYHKSYIIDLSSKVASVSLQDFAVVKEPLTSSGDDADDAANGSGSSALANRNKVRVLGSVVEALIHSALIIPRSHFTWKVVSETIVPLLLLKGKIFELLRNAGVASLGDTFRDLGGVLELERLRPGARLVLQRPAKAGGASKKGGGPRKSKGGDPNVVTSGSSSSGDHRFGAFSILTSSHLKPPLSLKACLKVLQMMSEAVSGDGLDDDNAFVGKTESQDFQEIRVYLLAVAQKHIDEFAGAMGKANHDESERGEDDLLEMATAVESVAKTAMADFKRFRRASGDIGGQGGLKALQIGESCASALSLLCAENRPIVMSFCRAILPPATDSVFSDDEGTFETTASSLEKLVESLLEDLMLKEVSVVLRIHDQLVRCITAGLGTVEKEASYLDKRAQWAVRVVSCRQIGDAGIVKTLVHLCLVYTVNNNDMRRGVELGNRLLKVIGKCDETEESGEAIDMDEGLEDGDFDTGDLGKAQAVEKGSCLPVVDAVCDVIERGANDVEWGLNRMVSLESSLDTHFTDTSNNEYAKQDGDEDEKSMRNKTAKHAIRAEDAAQIRLDGVIRTLRGLCRCAIAKWGQQERILKLTTRTYKLLSMATQAQAKRKGDPRTSFTSLINESKQLAPTLWTYLGFVGTDPVNDGGGRGGASKASKEARIMPQLVYEVERFEKVLIAAQKRTKISLLRGMRRHTARDFRIREDRLHGEDEGEVDGQAQDEEQAEEAGGENESMGGGSGLGLRGRRAARGRGGISKRQRVS